MRQEEAERHHTPFLLKHTYIRILVVVLAVVHVGCARVVYRHPDYTPQLWARDSYECERDARQSGYFGTGSWATMEMRNFYDRCLAARGWTKTRESIR